MKLSKKHFGRIALFHLKNLLGEVPKKLKKALGKSVQQKIILVFIETLKTQCGRTA